MAKSQRSRNIQSYQKIVYNQNQGLFLITTLHSLDVLYRQDQGQFLILDSNWK